MEEGGTMTTTPDGQRRCYHEWRKGLGLTDGQALALLTALGHVGIILDTTPGDVHLRLHTGSGNARLMGFAVLHGLRKAA
jgi:hypothetical protein